MNNNICLNCAYFIQECDFNGICCKDDIYTTISPQDTQCEDFILDKDNNIYEDYYDNALKNNI